MPQCPSCSRVAAFGRRFCGGCRTLLVRACTACGFDNELDDSWCGGCARALSARAVRSAKPTPEAPPVHPPSTSAIAAALLAINRRRHEPGAAVAGSSDVNDQGQLDALFGGGE